MYFVHVVVPWHNKPTNTASRAWSMVMRMYYVTPWICDERRTADSRRMSKSRFAIIKNIYNYIM